jgi:very-short-patch-repair endonuclease
MRTEMTDAERALWRCLRAHRRNGLSFRRQVPIGSFIVDFVCHDHKLIVELDGGQHAHDAAVARDSRREEWLRSKGYRILRFWNSDVLKNLGGVQQMILDSIATPLPNPPPQGGRGLVRARGKS